MVWREVISGQMRTQKVARRGSTGLQTVRPEIRALLADCPHVKLTEDGFGNLLALYRRGKAVPRFAFAAHMDHPAYVGREFLGGVPESYRRGKPATKKFGPFRMWDLPAC